MRFLVTGGAGFIGSHTVEALVAQGHAVKVLDNLSTGNRDNLKELKGRVEFLQGDIVDSGICLRAMENVDHVIHLAAEISVIRSVEDPVHTHRVNIDGTVNLLEAARKSGVLSFVFASSCAVYGDAPSLPIQETSPVSPLSPYAVSKLTGEQYCTLYEKVYGLKTRAFRFFNVCGPRQEDSSPYASVIAVFTRRLLRSQPVTIFGDGEQSRDFIFVKDVVKSLIVAALHPDAFPERIYNLATGEGTSVNRLYDLLANYTQNQSPAQHAAARAGEIKHSLGSSRSFAERCAGLKQPYSPTPLREALDSIVRWYASKA